MKHKISLLCIAAWLLIQLTACAMPSSVNSVESSQAQNTSDVLSTMQDGNDEALASPTQTGFFNLSRMRVSVFGSGTQGGYYQTSASLSVKGAANILYIDYASGKEIYLCAAPNCEHSTSACNAFIPPAEAGMFPLVAGEQLLLVYRPFGAEEYGRTTIPRIETVNLDGTNRRVLAELGAQEQLGDVFSANATTLVCSVRTRDEADTNLVRITLRSIDLQSGAQNDFYTTTAEAASFSEFFGVTEDGYCVMQTQAQTKTATDFPDLSEEEATKRAMSSVAQAWIAVPFGSDTAKTLCKQPALNVMPGLFDDGIYLYTTDNGEVTKISVPSGETEILAKLTPSEVGETGYLGGKIGDLVLLGTQHSTATTVTELCHAINVKDKTIRQLGAFYSLGDSRLTPELLAYDEQYVLLAQTKAAASNNHFGYIFELMDRDTYLSGGQDARRVQFVEG